MNILHLKYAVEIEKTKSISQAAKNLYMAQPNLSRAIKELEEKLGITIFDRTTKGISITPKGQEFLNYSKKILKQIDDIENMFTENYNDKQHFSVSVPRASYISHAFSRFVSCISRDMPIEIFYKETNSNRAISNILKADYKLGIIRYAKNYDKYFKEMLTEKGLSYETITEFTYVLSLSAESPLAKLDEITFDDLENFVEIAHADPYVPSLPLATVRKEELPDNINKRIFVYERASQYELLSTNPDTFMWVSPTPEDLLKKYNLVQKKCKANTKVYKDVLIYKNGYHLSELDNIFITELCNAKRKYI